MILNGHCNKIVISFIIDSYKIVVINKNSTNNSIII